MYLILDKLNNKATKFDSFDAWLLEIIISTELPEKMK